MGCSKSSCNLCGIVGVLIALAFGALVGVLFAFEFIPNIVTVAWIAFGLSAFALVFLAGSLIIAGVSGRSALSKCLCENTTCLLVGIIGTLIASIAALAIELVTIFASVAALVAIGAFFFAYMIVGLISFFTCISDKLCCYHTA